MAKPRNKRYHYILRNLLKLKVKLYSTIIDCACGDGYGSNILMSANMKVIGYDISKELINSAIHKGVEASEANICDLPCKDGLADVFVCSETLEHLGNIELEQAVGEIKRSTKKDGIICITVPSDKTLCLKNKSHKQYLSAKDLKRCFNNCDVLLLGQFCKKQDKCNTVIFFRKLV